MNMARVQLVLIQFPESEVACQPIQEGIDVETG
jgi:hypothetical protein